MSSPLTSDVHAAVAANVSRTQQQQRQQQQQQQTPDPSLHVEFGLNAGAAASSSVAAAAATEADFALWMPPTYSLPVGGEPYKTLHAEGDEYPEPTAAQRANPLSKFCDILVKGHTFANQRREQIQAELRSIVGSSETFLIDSRVSAHGVTQRMRIQHVLAQVQERHHVGPAWVKEAYKRVRKHKAATAGTAATAATLTRSSSRSSTRSGSSTPTTEDEMCSFASSSAINAASMPLPSLPSLPLPSTSMTAAGLTTTMTAARSTATAESDGSIKPLVKMSAYNLVKGLGADLSSVDKTRQATAAAAAVEQATSEAIVAMEVWGDAQLALMAATDALPTATAASSKESVMATAIVKANQAEKKASAAAKVAALMLAQAKHDQLGLELSSRPASTTPQTPQSNTSMLSCDSGNSDGGNDGDDEL